MAYLGSTHIDVNGSTTTSASQDTTGAKLIVIGVQYRNNNPGAPTDNKGNTYTGLTPRGAGFALQQLWYCENPTVGTGHTFTQTSSAATNNDSVTVSWYDGMVASSMLDFEGGASALSASIGAPNQANSLIVFAGAEYYLSAGDTYSVNAGFTVAQNYVNAATCIPACVAYLIQTSAAAVTPTWSHTPSGDLSQICSYAVFKMAGGGGGGTTPLNIITPNQGIVLASAARRSI